MSKRKPGYWKKFYREHREQRLAASIAYQREHADTRRAYMREWLARNRERVAAYRKQTAEQRNASRRERYKSDPAYREATKQAVRACSKRHPKTKLAQVLRKYGLTIADYDAMLSAQHGRCAICARTNSGDSRGHRYHVDHCHATGRVRGLLCSNCNLGIGKFGDSADRLERAAMYLRSCERQACSS